MGSCGCCSHVHDRPLSLNFTTLQSDTSNWDEVKNEKVAPKESDCLPSHTKVVDEMQGDSQDLLTEKEGQKIHSSHTTVGSSTYSSGSGGSSANRTNSRISREKIIATAFDKYPVNKVDVNASAVGLWIHKSLPIHCPEQEDIWLARAWSSSTQNRCSTRETEASSFKYLNDRSLSAQDAAFSPTKLLKLIPDSSLEKSSSEPIPSPWSAGSITEVANVPHCPKDIIEEFELVDNLPDMLSNKSPTKKENGGQLGSLHNSISPFKCPTTSESTVDLQCWDSGSRLLDSAKKVKTDEEITPAETYRSLVAPEIESECCPNGGDCYGVMPWDICWLRDDDGNSQ